MSSLRIDGPPSQANWVANCPLSNRHAKRDGCTNGFAMTRVAKLRDSNAARTRKQKGSCGSPSSKCTAAVLRLRHRHIPGAAIGIASSRMDRDAAFSYLKTLRVY